MKVAVRLSQHPRVVRTQEVVRMVAWLRRVSYPMTEQNNLEIPLDNQAQLGWRVASDLLNPFGPTAANFGEAIRALSLAFERGQTSLNHGAESHVLRLLKNKTITATYFFFSKQFRPSVLEGKSYLSERDFFRAYTPFEHASILALCYLFKTLSRKIDKEEWEYVQTPLYEALAIGAGVGQQIPEVGLGIGLLQRGIRYLALAPLVRENKRAFKEYRHHLKTKDLAFDSSFEESMWQCSTVQIASILLERMGFPRALGLQYVASAAQDSTVQADTVYGVPIRIAESIIDSYMETQEVPTSLPSWVGKQMNLSAETRGNLVAAFTKTLADKNLIEWLNKGGSSIDPASTPQLFTESEKQAFEQERSR